MKKQQKIQPLMAELQKKYANDQEKLQREMMKIYKENNIKYDRRLLAYAYSNAYIDWSLSGYLETSFHTLQVLIGLMRRLLTKLSV